MLLSLTYSDISLVPRRLSTINSRDDIDTSSDFLGNKYKLPILSAPMKTVTGSVMARKLISLGCLPVLARTENAQTDLEAFQASADIPGAAAVSVGATGDFLERAAKFIQAGARIICIDTANGFHTTVAHAVKQLQKSRVPIKIIAGNVGSVEGYKFLDDLGVDAVRVGIGNGSVCSTSIATGIGMGQISLLQEIRNYRGRTESAAVIADGGIKEPGDIAKAIALGADVVMVGSYFAGTEESPGEVLEGDKFSNRGKYKRYAGEASRSVKGNNAKYVEGIETWVPFKGKVAEQVQALEDGLKSSMGYMNCRTLTEFRNLPENCLVQLSSNARIERTPHIHNR